ncbi:FAD-dependent oxidoreductase [Pseudaquabacterium terrae]|uniref:FAD-dependent oxidoreductase n=1 Tax=Pseudaquabacterium terrae TaxID=2732868 RepID=UPI0031B5BBA7
MSWRRRSVLAAGVALVAGCEQRPATHPAVAGAQWLGAAHARGHRLRTARSGAPPAPAVQRRTDVLVIGAGIAGLAAARALQREGVGDLALLELEDQPGGNSRGHALGGLSCPLGAHYLPVPGDAAHEVRDWLQQIGLMSLRAGRWVADERHLCHSPQERLFFDGAWHEGLLPPAEPGSATLEQYRAFAQRVAAAQRLGFALPTQRARWTAEHAALDAVTFVDWLTRERLVDERLRWYLDYACRDDYGAGLGEVSAWAGLHYFASRHGFDAPGDGDGARDAVFTWPEGNAWLVERLAAPLRDRLHGGRTVLRMAQTRDGVDALAWDESSGRAEAWHARAVLLCVPLFVAARLIDQPSDALRAAAAQQPHAPWLVANLQLRAPLLDRGIGAPAAWDNVRYGGGALGYVDAGHQRLSPLPQPTVLTTYWALPRAQRGALLDGSAASWAQQVVDELLPLHPDLPEKLERIVLMRYGHAMSIPVPGLRSSPALAALARSDGRVRFAHSDLSAYSIFEEAFTHGDSAGTRLARWLRAAA